MIVWAVWSLATAEGIKLASCRGRSGYKPEDTGVWWLSGRSTPPWVMPANWSFWIMKC